MRCSRVCGKARTSGPRVPLKLRVELESLVEGFRRSAVLQQDLDHGQATLGALVAIGSAGRTAAAEPACVLHSGTGRAIIPLAGQVNRGNRHIGMCGWQVGIGAVLEQQLDQLNLPGHRRPVQHAPAHLRRDMVRIRTDPH